ncbi:MAG TPA: PA2778 family cysteine peptidase [Methylotenera sp.]
MILRSFILAFAFLLSACAATGVREVTQSSQLPRQAELTKTPFFPQELYHCGPAALATALNAIDVKVSPDQLVPEVYIPSRKGSLQIEMLAAARRHGALAVKIEPELGAVLKEIAAGNVVLVMQNLGLSWAPSWHYAVVVGYDLDKELVWLRSGTFERFEMSLSAFQRTWARSKYWAFVALKPGDLPASTGVEAVISALIPLEKTVGAAKASVAYAAAAKRWPGNLVLLTGLGNSAFVTGDLQGAASAFREATSAHPDSAAAHNNLANVLLAQGDVIAAKASAQKALQLAEKDQKLQSQIQKTIDEINAYSIKK